MYKSIKTAALSFAFIGFAVSFSGCEVNDADVAAARDNVIEEKNETQEAREQAGNEIHKKEIALEEARQMVKRPSYDGDQSEVAAKERELEETRQEHEENVREEERQTKLAKAETEELERKLTAKKARDSYVADINMKVELVDQKIATMKDKRESLEGLAGQELETDIELLEVKRDNVNDAISNLNNADVLVWESQKDKVEQAMKRLEKDE